jgi:hypothetical protein
MSHNHASPSALGIPTTMTFDERLQRAIERGQRHREEQTQEALAKAMSEDELRRLHSQLRLELSEYIETCLQRLPNHFPGFQIETMFGERGWGAACSRDDVGLDSTRRRGYFYSRLELTIRPPTSYGVLELSGKATVRNKELFNRTYYEELPDANPRKFREMIDRWVLEYAERYAANT